MKSNITDKRLQELAKKWLDKTITTAEQQEFADWYNSENDLSVEIPKAFADSEEVLKERILIKINEAIKPENTNIKPIILKRWVSIAATLLLFSSIGIYYYNHKSPYKKNALVHQRVPANNDIKPGGNKAVLTLANGNKINLNDIKNGVLTNQGKTQVKKDKDGLITYQAITSNENEAPVFNTINIPKGGQFQVVLSDGSKVWLNSASSITFPTAFSKTERRITISGEVYLEVAKNKALPFRVVTGKQVIEVLGTHFNINAYPDEPAIKTTLAEGSVKVMADGQTVMLKPEQQSAVINNHSENISVKTVDIENVLAWKNGNFQFEKAEIPFIMREISRWYNVDIKYEGKMPQRIFSGSISRSVNLSEFLRMLKYSGIDFKIQGQTIIVAA
ncbi:FecR family protein [Mucilaginibacter sp.]|uniref:FecR family protein n=1 Tax=Mucilaginibacter sp. TaxID=1882438 RepID=UPI003D0C33AF